MATAVKRETRRDTNISLDKPIYTISVASEILETHPRTLMMYEHLGWSSPSGPRPTVGASRSATS